MNKRYYLTLLVLFPFMLSSQISTNSKIRSFQLGLNTGFGYNRWEGLLYPGSAEIENGVSIVNSLDFLYRMNRLKIGIGLGLDQYFFSPFGRKNTTFFPKAYIQTEYFIWDGRFLNGPNFQFGFMMYYLDSGPNHADWANAHTFFASFGWTFQHDYNQNWSMFFKPVFEYKWPKIITDEGERIYSLYVQIGARYRFEKN